MAWLRMARRDRPRYGVGVSAVGQNVGSSSIPGSYFSPKFRDLDGMFYSHPLRSVEGAADGAFIPWSVSSLRLYEAQGPVSGPPGAARRKSQIPSGFAIRAVLFVKGGVPPARPH